VRHLLEGSVRRAANRLRIPVRLSDCESGLHVWSETYDRGLEDIFAVQEEIANSVTSALRVTLSPTDRAALARTPTRIVEAYELYLQASGHESG
jgi:adenylate cyclase